MPVGLLKDIIGELPQNKALLGLDVGKKTIGIALCDPGRRVATPLQTLKRVKFTQDAEALVAITKEYEVGGYVVGLPVNMNGSEGPRAQSVRDFALELNRALGGKSWIALWDERLSTFSVEETVDNLVDKRKTLVEAKTSGLVDKLAAQVILQGALDFIDRNG
jgi:putative Holliday junction resolvase